MRDHGEVRIVIWTLATATMAACSFRIDASSAGPDPDASKPIDAAIDAPGPGSEPPMKAWIVIDTLTVSIASSSSTSTSQVVLATGVEYHLRVMGVADCGSGGYSCDAEYYWNGGPPLDVSGSVDVGLSIDDQSINATKTPLTWGPYAASHEYEQPFTGKGAPITASFADSNYSGNNGTFTVQVLEYK